MTPVAWSVVVVVGVAVVAALATHWLTAARAARILERRERSLEEHTELQRVQALQRNASERRASEAAANGLEELRAARRLSDAAYEVAMVHAKQLTGERDRWEMRARVLASICRVDASATAPLYPDRPSPTELDAISGRVRGLAFIDSVSDRGREWTAARPRVFS